MGLENARTTSKKRQIEPYAGPTSEESVPLPPKEKKIKLSVESSRPSAMNTHHNPSNTKTMDNLVASKDGKKRPSQADNDISIETDPEIPVRPFKKAKVAAPIRRTGKIIVDERYTLTIFFRNNDISSWLKSRNSPA